MKLKIKANTLTTQRYLEVKSSGVTFCETALMGGRRTFPFRDIDVILMSPENVLSFQVGREVFKLPVKPHHPQHRQVIDTLVQEVRQTV